jgi:hypothetical protein
MRRGTPAVAKRHRANSRSQTTRERILDAAEQLFAARGFHGCSIRDITGAARATWRSRTITSAASSACSKPCSHAVRET